MEQGSERSYGLGLSRDAHIAFAAAYVAVLLTIAGFGVQRFVAQLPNLHWPQVVQAAASQSQVAYRARPVPDPSIPHQIGFYPRVALINHQQGMVVVRLLVLRSGEVGDATILRSSGYPQLDAAALVGTGNWRYLPAVRDGQPVSAEVDVSIRFRLAQG